MIRFNTMAHAVSYGAACLVSLWALPVMSQETPGTSAVANQEGDAPADGEAFFPLVPGSVMDFEGGEAGTLRRSVVGDTIVAARRYVSVIDTMWAPSGDLVGAYHYIARYDADATRVVVWDGQTERLSSRLAPCPLTGGGAVVCASTESAELRDVTEGEGGLPFDPYHVVATRTFASELGFGVLVLAEGIGPVLIVDSERTYALQYARIGGEEVGTPLRPLLQNAQVAAPPRLRAWPNPSAGRITLHYEGAGSGPVTADVFDALGRRVLVIPFPAGGDTRDIVVDLAEMVSPGAYTVRVRGGAVTRVVAL